MNEAGATHCGGLRSSRPTAEGTELFTEPPRCLSVGTPAYRLRVAGSQEDAHGV
jgi:hypothetical protein